MLNRSIICRIANSLRRCGYTLSQAFRMAWRLAKGRTSVGSGKPYKMGYISAAVDTNLKIAVNRLLDLPEK